MTPKITIKITIGHAEPHPMDYVRVKCKLGGMVQKFDEKVVTGEWKTEKKP